MEDRSPTAEAIATAAEVKSQLAQITAASEVKPQGGRSEVDRECPQEVGREKLVAKARPFVPSGQYPTTWGPACKRPDCNGPLLEESFQSFLTLVGQRLMSAHGVANVDVKVGMTGALATINVQLNSGASARSVITASKSALLDVAAGSQRTYVMGYEATPFQDDIAGSGFCTALASMPADWECSACWDSYTIGFCPRKQTCKWQHPGFDHVQPLRVVVQ